MTPWRHVYEFQGVISFALYFLSLQYSTALLHELVLNQRLAVSAM